jgi:voltage-gated potassium channel
MVFTSYNKIVLAFLFCFFVILGGTFGYTWLEGWPLDESLYMTIITISTVGFGEIHTMGFGGHILTMVLILSGVVAIGYTVSVVSATIISGEIALVMRGQRMERRLSRLKSHVILCGYGKIGREVAREFIQQGDNICVVDNESRNVEQALDDGLLAILGDATEEHILERCGILHARGILTALPRDSDNLFVVLTAKELNPKVKVVSRGLEPSSENRLLRAGADHVVSPYVIGGRRMAAVFLHPEILDFLDIFMKEDAIGYSLSQYKITTNSALSGKKLSEGRLRETSGGAMVLGLSRDGKMEGLPGADTEICPGDVLVILGTQDMMDRLGKAGY